MDAIRVRGKATPLRGTVRISGVNGLGSNTAGNTVTLNVEPDTRAETDKLFNALAKGGQVDMPLAAQFWGGYFGILVDKFGIRWMFNCAN